MVAVVGFKFGRERGVWEGERCEGEEVYRIRGVQKSPKSCNSKGKSSHMAL